MKRMTQKKIEALHKLIIPISKEIREINYGGCGIFAIYLCRLLNEKGYACKAMCLDATSGRTKRDHRYNLRRIAHKDEHNVHGYNHICVQVGKFYIDSCTYERVNTTGIFAKQYRELGPISLENLDYLINMKWNWNDVYDRRQNKRLRLMLSKSLDKF